MIPGPTGRLALTIKLGDGDEVAFGVVVTGASEAEQAERTTASVTGAMTANAAHLDLVLMNLQPFWR